MSANDEATFLVGYCEAAAIVGLNQLNEAIATGKLKPIRLNDKPGAPNLFPRSIVERLAARAREG